MPDFPQPRCRLIIARHGETVFNAAGRLQGTHLHTPLTRSGFAQADAMGAALRERLGAQLDLALWASDTGRANQTLAIITEHLGLDWHDTSTDPRLREIDTGAWGGCYYADLARERGSVIDAETGLLLVAPEGEDYPAIAARLAAWLAEHGQGERDMLVIMHGISSRILRGMLTGLPPLSGYGVPVGPGLPQGSVVSITHGREEILVTGTGGGRA